jgi:hypothetical protein
MDKIFDHRHPSQGWIAFDHAPKDVAKEIMEIWSGETECDRDGGNEYVIEHWESATGVITFFTLDVWWDRAFGGPAWSAYHTTNPAEVDAHYWKPTTVKPDKDYVFVSKFPTTAWPPSA